MEANKSLPLSNTLHTMIGGGTRGGTRRPNKEDWGSDIKGSASNLWLSVSPPGRGVQIQGEISGVCMGALSLAASFQLGIPGDLEVPRLGGRF